MNPLPFLDSAPARMDGITRRQWLAYASTAVFAGTVPNALALPPRQMQFPRDFGSHPDLRTEWWYITGQALAGGQRWGFQVTFFRSRVDAAQPLKSAFAARQLVFAHAALTDLAAGQLHHDQRIARVGFGVAEASESDTDIRLQDWSLRRTDQGTGSRYRARVAGNDFALDLVFDSTQPPLLQGQQGLSRKGPDASQASYYYSQPQLQVSGSLLLAGRSKAVEPATQPGDNRAWMDHEASEALMHPQAVGWDWIGMNLHDGSALTAFRLRRADGSTLWTGGSFRASGAAARVFADGEVVFTPLRWWTSPLGQTRYPVQWRVDTPSGSFEVRALLDNQELDSRGSTGAIYWEGLCALHTTGGATGANGGGAVVGGGYLEMTGYAQVLRL